ncbi:MAG: gamma-glutamyl-gamma-aminobutyrate hydrolase family protein [Candidatus Zixiibacteriota bacterium]
MPESPVILMTLRGCPTDESRRQPTVFEFEWLQNFFGEAVARAGGVPIFVSNECRPGDVVTIINRCDGLFLTGGEDVEPWRFGAEDTVGNLDVYPKRDAIEFAAIEAADACQMPILGVCRGAQVLNVARGGTIYQDLEQEYPTKPRDHSRGKPGLTVQTHDITINSGSRLHRLLGTEHVNGATSHHQAIRDLGHGLVAVGFSPEDNVIEAVEDEGDRFVFGVQWHPEINNDDSTTLKLFKGFVEACAQYATRRMTVA